VLWIQACGDTHVVPVGTVMRFSGRTVAPFRLKEACSFCSALLHKGAEGGGKMW